MNDECSSDPASRSGMEGLSVRCLYALVLLFVLVLAGCDRYIMTKRMIPAQDAAVARGYAEAVRRGEYETIERDAGPSLRGPGLRETLRRLTGAFPSISEEPKSITAIDLAFYKRKDLPMITGVTLEYEFSGKWVLAQVTTEKIDGVVELAGIKIQPIPAAIETLNGFTFANKGWPQYALLFLAVASPLLSLCAIVVCVRTAPRRSRWIWLGFILIGVGKLAVNWTTGELSFTPLAVQIVPGGAYALGYAPWMVYVSLPIGALAFLFYRSPRTAPNRSQPDRVITEPVKTTRHAEERHDQHSAS